MVLQTFDPFDDTIRAALRQDYASFARRELESRRATSLPPFGRMVRVVLRDQDEEKLIARSEALAGTFFDAATACGTGSNSVDVRGPMPCPIGRIAGYFRQQIVLAAGSAVPLQRVLARVRDAGHLAGTDRLAVDVDPVNLL